MRWRPPRRPVVVDPSLLVKLLDAGERLPVHFRPDAAFARSRPGPAHGKTEAWLIVETRVGRPSAWVGFASAGTAWST